MDLYQLKAFFILAKVRNFTRTAEFLSITQSAVSHAIKKLEGSVDTKLLERKGKTISLTPAGIALFDSCETIFNEIDKADEKLRFYKKRAKQTVKIGAPVEFGTTILIKHIKKFLVLNKNIHLDFYFSHDLRTPLVRDEVDFIIDCESHPINKVQEFYLFKEQYICIASPEYIKEHRLRDISDLSRINILSLDKKLRWWRNFFEAIPKDQQPSIKMVVQINHIRGLINGAISGMGVAFVPKYTVLDELSEKILIDPFPGIKPEADHFSIYIKENRLSLNKNHLLVDYLTKVKPSEFGAKTKN